MVEKEIKIKRERKYIFFIPTLCENPKRLQLK